MKKSNSTKKALGAFKKLGAVALITATMFFTACNQAGGGGGEKPTPTPTPKPKHDITFSVDSTTPNGTLKAKADDVDETEKSPISIEEGKTVTFTAKANDGYRVKGWTLDNSLVAEAGTNTEYKLKVSKPATVSVSFEAIPPTKYTVTLNQTEHGTVTASPAIPTDKQVPKDTVITFTATANEGYKIGKWTVTGSALEAGTGTDGSSTAKVKITADTTVSVSFEVTFVEGSASLILSPDKLTIKVEAITADGSAITVEGCKEATLKSGVETELHAKGTTVILKGKITELDCSSNKLTELNVQGCVSLQELSCYENKLTTLNVQGLTSLQNLDCSINKLTELNVQGFASLKELSCYENKLTTLNVQGLTSLQILDCSINELTELNVQGLTSLKNLRYWGNKLNAQAMTKLLNALPDRELGDKAFAILYNEQSGKVEGNCKDFTQPEDLKKAFEGAKKRNWKLFKGTAGGNVIEI